MTEKTVGDWVLHNPDESSFEIENGEFSSTKDSGLFVSKNEVSNQDSFTVKPIERQDCFRVGYCTKPYIDNHGKKAIK